MNPELASLLLDLNGALKRIETFSNDQEFHARTFPEMADFHNGVASGSYRAASEIIGVLASHGFYPAEEAK
jgi:hypothetical protein